MRPLILLAALTFSLAACKNNDQADNTQNIDENLAAENIVSNDVTAIDAVTGDAANMAADVDYSNMIDNSLDNMVNETGAGSSSPKPKAKTARPATTKPAASTPATNSVENSSANGA